MPVSRPKKQPKASEPTQGGGGGFKLPKGVAPEGLYPELVEWPQGETLVSYNLFTGKQQWSGRKSDGQKPNEGFKVVSWTRKRPPQRAMSMGLFNVNTTREGLDFEQSQPGDGFKNRKVRDNRFRSRSRP